MKIYLLFYRRKCKKKVKYKESFRRRRRKKICLYDELEKNNFWYGAIEETGKAVLDFRALLHHTFSPHFSHTNNIEQYMRFIEDQVIGGRRGKRR